MEAVPQGESERVLGRRLKQQVPPLRSTIAKRMVELRSE
jgi:hypothetical protein